MWSLHGSAASVSSSRPVSRWRLESTLYHHLLLPPRFVRAFFHTPQPVTGHRDCRGSVMCAIHRDTTPLSQRVGACTSNSYVRALSLSSPILPSLLSRSAAERVHRCMVEWNEGMFVYVEYDIS